VKLGLLGGLEKGKRHLLFFDLFPPFLDLKLLGAACMLAGAVVIVLAVDAADGGPGHMSDYQV